MNTSATSQVLHALAEARTIELGRPVEHGMPVSPSHPPFRMALTRRHGDKVRKDGTSGASELITLGTHTGTHIDALCHASKDGKLYGGIPADEAVRGGRFTVHGVETIAPLIGRGVLLDVPALHGLDALPAAHRIDADQVRECAAAQGTEIRAGDVVVIRTGWPALHDGDTEGYVGWRTGVPGPDSSAARLFADLQVRAVGSDTIAFEWLAPGAEHSSLPCHAILLVESGINIIEVLDLEELAAAGAHEFLFVACPLRLVGATGSPIRPVAVAL